MLKLQFSVLVVFVASAATLQAAPVVFEYRGHGTGTIDGVSFGPADYVIRAEGTTDDWTRIPDYGWSVTHTEADITITGLGTYLFEFSTATFVSDENAVSLMHAVSLVSMESTALSDWDMLSSIGPITGDGWTGQWDNFGSPLLTDGGVIYLDDATDDITFSAQVSPEPASLSLLAIGGLTLLRRRRK